jgi:hypothetical protein
MEIEDDDGEVTEPEDEVEAVQPLGDAWKDPDGTFCVHENDVGKCRDVCGDCGHACSKHQSAGEASECQVKGCECEEFVDDGEGDDEEDDEGDGEENEDEIDADA